MLSGTSRYTKTGTSILTTESGKQVAYINRRILPPLPTTSYSINNNVLSDIENITMTVSAGDRLDNIAARSIGDPEQYWKICDVNDIMHPLDLTLKPGRTLTIPMPGGALDLVGGGG